ncbi:hypothetical protein [Candidatus Symbiopectobacterium sp. PLON1]|uniref:hypothetical protein n=1 Tax=Candidatus Symbiopectobacterium sp. PLON1 TaxID=2794575 RepID=UPI0025BC885D|nr:hypothetical protein [Candidatus Symbiopectobacterium sp. PLON1]
MMLAHGVLLFALKRGNDKYTQRSQKWPRAVSEQGIKQEKSKEKASTREIELAKEVVPSSITTLFFRSRFSQRRNTNQIVRVLM